jgi:hypothetical protein
MLFSRTDIESLCDRIEARAWSPLFLDMPEHRKDIRSSAAILRLFVSMGVPVTAIEVDVFNGII